jgi:nitrate reductase assembly molybdenum cofactor insertion protein NarJ
MTTLGALERKLLSEAAEWRLLSILFEYPSAGWKERLCAVAADVTDGVLLQAAGWAKEQASEGMHHSIFGPGGPVSPREATYSNGVQLGYLMAELNAFYAAFGYSPRTAEAADHVAVETGFLAYLRLKQAYASASGSEAEALIAQEAAAEFLEQHLRSLAEPVASGLESVAPPYLALAGRALLDRAGTRPPPVLRVLTEVDENIDACGVDSIETG